MEILIRNEREEDHRTVEEVTREAFWNLYVPGCSEHYLVHTLRDHQDFIPELDFVALVDGRVVGNIMYTRATLSGEAGERLAIASFGPVSVLPAHQRQGIGARLIQHSLRAAGELGWQAVAIYGDPHNYCKHGFRNGKDLGISDGNGDYPHGLLALELAPGVLAGRHWRLQISPAYECSESEVAAFDRGFPPKAKAHPLLRAGCPLHYWTGGTGERPLIAFLHGATMDHRMFNTQIEALAPHTRVLTWDARGHGQSQPIGADFSLTRCAEDLLAILDAQGVDQAIFCGQSLGGYIAQHIYRLAPERVQALIIIGSTPIAKAYSRSEIWALKASLPLFRLWPYGHFTQTIARMHGRRPEVQAYMLQAARQIPRAAFMTIWEAVSLAVNERGDPSLRFAVPLLLLHGDHDRAGTIRRDMPQWARQEPGATYQVIPDASHNANQDNPEFTNQAILTFLQQQIGDSHVPTVL